MSDSSKVALTIPGLLEFRDVAMRVVMESCKLVGRCDEGSSGGSGNNGEKHSLTENFKFTDELTLAFSSAFSEIFNNIVLHAYRDSDGGTIDLEFTIAADHLAVQLTDQGKSFDIDAVKPLDDPLPMGGMGIHIARTMLDELVYESGPPNRWRLVKYVQQPQEQPASTPASVD